MPKHYKLTIPTKQKLDRLSEVICNNTSTNKVKDEKQKKWDHHDISKSILKKFRFISIQNTPWVWLDDLNYYVPFTLDQADPIIRNNVPKKARHLINPSSIHNIYKWIISNKKIRDTSKINTNLDNFIIFNNGIYDIEQERLMEHSPQFFYTTKLPINYVKETSISETVFKEFIHTITNGDKRLKKRLQELFGYIISEIRTVKYLPFLVGPKDTGKSILLNLFESLVGENNFTNISIDQLKQKEFLAELESKKLNACGEIAEMSLKRLDILKKLTGTDGITARSLHNNPIKFKNNAVLLFAGNHLPNTAGIDHSNAFTDRMVIFPFNNPIPKNKQDIQLLDKLQAESSKIIQWAIEGLIRWKKNNYIFTESDSTQNITLKLQRQNNSIEFFIKEACKFKKSAKVHNHKLIKAYHKYCDVNSCTPLSDQAFHKYLKHNINLSYSRFRLKGKNAYGYHGIKTIKSKHSKKNKEKKGAISNE